MPCAARRRLLTLRNARSVRHRKDDEARRFYEHFNFDPSPADQHQLFWS